MESGFVGIKGAAFSLEHNTNNKLHCCYLPYSFTPSLLSPLALHSCSSLVKNTAWVLLRFTETILKALQTTWFDSQHAIVQHNLSGQVLRFFWTRGCGRDDECLSRQRNYKTMKVASNNQTPSGNILEIHANNTKGKPPCKKKTRLLFR